jgi:hypothetical protein
MNILVTLSALSASVVKKYMRIHLLFFIASAKNP